MPARPDLGGAFRALWTFDREDYAAHLSRLSPEDRRSRFHGPVNDAAIKQHAERALTGGGHIIGWFKDGELRAAAEIAITPDGEAAEAAFEVESSFRRRGVGSELVARALLWARNRGARRLFIHTTRGNVPMLRAARRRGASFEFDLTDAEGVIEAAKPNWMSHLQEARLIEEGWLRWFMDSVRGWPRKVLGLRGSAL